MLKLAYFRPTQEFNKPDLSTVQSPDKLHNIVLFTSKSCMGAMTLCQKQQQQIRFGCLMWLREIPVKLQEQTLKIWYAPWWKLNFLFILTGQAFEEGDSPQHSMCSSISKFTAHIPIVLIMSKCILPNTEYTNVYKRKYRSMYILIIQVTS